LVFENLTSTKDISQALGVNYTKSTDLASGIIFVKGDRIVYDEYYKRYLETAPKFFIAPRIHDDYQSPPYRVFTKDEAVFVCYQIDSYAGPRYYLDPKE
jgi:hypothetical protein